MNIAHQTVIGEDGKPQAAIIPWSVFIEIQELVDDDGLEEVRQRAEELDRDPSMGMTMDEFKAACGR
ncbi:MAG: hypothetical protein ACJAQT_003225 [Akkermansiaceae bacterium]|jgi:hypothetical protein